MNIKLDLLVQPSKFYQKGSTDNYDSFDENQKTELKNYLNSDEFIETLKLYLNPGNIYHSDMILDKIVQQEIDKSLYLQVYVQTQNGDNYTANKIKNILESNFNHYYRSSQINYGNNHMMLMVDGITIDNEEYWNSHGTDVVNFKFDHKDCTCLYYSYIYESKLKHDLLHSECYTQSDLNKVVADVMGFMDAHGAFRGRYFCVTDKNHTLLYESKSDDGFFGNMIGSVTSTFKKTISWVAGVFGK